MGHGGWRMEDGGTYGGGIDGDCSGIGGGVWLLAEEGVRCQFAHRCRMGMVVGLTQREDRGSRICSW